MTPFKLQVNWACHDAYGDQVVVELHRLDRKNPTILRRFDEPGPAVSWARKWMEDRGFGFWCNVDWHQREGHTHVTLHPAPTGHRAQHAPSSH